MEDLCLDDRRIGWKVAKQTTANIRRYLSKVAHWIADKQKKNAGALNAGIFVSLFALRVLDKRCYTVVQQLEALVFHIHHVP